MFNQTKNDPAKIHEVNHNKRLSPGSGPELLLESEPESTRAEVGSNDALKLDALSGEPCAA